MEAEVSTGKGLGLPTSSSILLHRLFLKSMKKLMREKGITKTIQVTKDNQTTT